VAPRQDSKVEVAVEDIAKAIEDEVRRVLVNLLGKRASSFLIIVKLDYNSNEINNVEVAIEAYKGIPGVEFDAVVHKALEAAESVARKYIRKPKRPQ
jgi:hypothetical protein